MGGCASRPKDLKGEALDELPVADEKCAIETPVANVATEPIVESKVETYEIAEEKEPLVDLAEPETTEKTNAEEALAEQNVVDEETVVAIVPKVTEEATTVTEEKVAESEEKVAVKEEKPEEKEEEVVVQ